MAQELRLPKGPLKKITFLRIQKDDLRLGGRPSGEEGWGDGNGERMAKQEMRRWMDGQDAERERESV